MRKVRVDRLNRKSHVTIFSHIHNTIHHSFSFQCIHLCYNFSESVIDKEFLPQIFVIGQEDSSK